MAGGGSRHLSRGLSDQAPAGTEGGRAQSRRWPATAEQRASGLAQMAAGGSRMQRAGRLATAGAEDWVAGHRGSRGRAGPPEQRAAGRSRLQGRRPPAEQRAGATRESRAQGRRRLLISREIFVATSQNPLSLPRLRAPVTPRARAHAAAFSRSGALAQWPARGSKKKQPKLVVPPLIGRLIAIRRRLVGRPGP